MTYLRSTSATLGLIIAASFTIFVLLHASDGSSARLPENVLASVRGTNNQFAQQQLQDGTKFFTTCASLNAGPDNETLSICQSVDNDTPCIRCNSQTVAPAIDENKRVATSGWSAAANSIACSGFVITGGSCQGGVCSGGKNSTTTCDKDVKDWVQQAPIGNN